MSILPHPALYGYFTRHLFSCITSAEEIFEHFKLYFLLLTHKLCLKTFLLCFRQNYKMSLGARVRTSDMEILMSKGVMTITT